MTQKEFKDKIFEQRQKDKSVVSELYNRNAILKNFLSLINKVNYKDFMRLDFEGQDEIIRNIFGDNKQMMKSIIQDKITQSLKLGKERLQTKQNKK